MSDAGTGRGGAGHLFSVAIAIAVAGAGCADRSADGPPVVHYGQDVCAACNMIVSEERFAAALVVKTDGLDGHRDLGSHDLYETDVVLIELPLTLVQHLHHTQRRGLRRHERNRHHVAGDVAHLVIDVLRVCTLGSDILRHERRAGPEDASREPLARLKLRAGQLVSLLPDHVLEDELALGRTV